ncbi:hypothetical protein Tco_0754195 [Tanacetum coccineum]
MLKPRLSHLPDTIHGSVMVTKPKTMQDAIEFATELMGVIVILISTHPHKVEATKKKVKKPNVHVAELVYGAMLHADVQQAVEKEWAIGHKVTTWDTQHVASRFTNESGSDTGLHPRHLRDKGTHFT